MHLRGWIETKPTTDNYFYNQRQFNSRSRFQKFRRKLFCFNMPSGQCNYREAMEKLRFILDETKLQLPTYGSTSKVNLSEPQMEHMPFPNDKYKNLPNYSELLALVNQQDCYIVQLENENKFCKDELFSLKNDVDDVIIENYQVHEEFQDVSLKVIDSELQDFAQQNDLHVLQERPVRIAPEHIPTRPEDDQEKEEFSIKEKPPLVKQDTSKWLKELETIKSLHLAKTARLETQLQYTKSELEKCEQEMGNLKIKLSKQIDGFLLPESTVCSRCQNKGIESYQPNFAGLKGEHDELQLLFNHKLQQLNEFQQRETEALNQVKKSIELAEEAQLEKTQAVLQKKQLDDELIRMKKRMEDIIAESQKKIVAVKEQIKAESQLEIKELIDKIQKLSETQLNAENQLDKVEREKRTLTAELEQARTQQNNFNIELNKVTETLKSEMLQTMIERDQMLSEFNQFKFNAEKKVLDKEQENIRLVMDLTALRQRFEQMEWEYMGSKEQCIQLTENITKLEKQLNSSKIAKESIERTKTLDIKSLHEKVEQKEEQFLIVIQNMQIEHAEAMCEMEKIFNSQNSLISKLREECNVLSEKLEILIEKYRSETDKQKHEFISLRTQLDKASTKHQLLENDSINQKQLQEELQNKLIESEDQNEKLSDQVQILLAKQKILKNERQLIFKELNVLYNVDS